MSKVESGKVRENQYLSAIIRDFRECLFPFLFNFGDSHFYDADYIV